MEPVIQNLPGSFAVVNTQIISFVPGENSTITDQDKTDVINSTLLAQLAANENASSYSHLEAWMSSFMNTAAVLGWTLHSGSTFKTVNKSKLQISMDVVTAKLIGQSGRAEDIRILEALLYLKGADSPIGLDILEEYGKTKTTGTFQFVICEKNSDDKIIIRIFPFAFETIEKITSTIFQPIIKGDTYKMKYMGEPTVASLNMDLYNQVRDSVNNKVEGYVNDRTAYLPI